MGLGQAASRITYHGTGSTELEKAVRDTEMVYGRMREVIASRRAEPTGNLLSILMEQSPVGGPLDDKEIFDLCVQLMGGSIETTTALIANALMYLGTDHISRSRLI